ncbi:hypothetical protein [Oceanobacillus halophilus]|uniref:Uncharacterized protein n=1 Tax=Oceanobacillus halophilus TaxID=930130 RepID=A0A495A329_9BACI|nr:hypothetical protein [Oceanobacillus halophilus]RKQ33977.1 hypothetical protein D8M06_09145 [Oceanobacillus halophilus]
MKLTGLKDDFLLLSEKPKGLRIFLGQERSNILIFHPIEELRRPSELMAHISGEEKAYLLDKLNNQMELVAYIRKLPLMKSSYTLFFQAFDDVFRYVFHSKHEDLLDYLKEKSRGRNYNYIVVKDGEVREVPYF